MKQLLTFVLLLQSFILVAQSYEWVETFGSFGANGGRSIKVDAAGNIYTLGFFYGTADFDPGAGTTNLSTTGGTGVFVQKMDASRNLIWA